MPNKLTAYRGVWNWLPLVGLIACTAPEVKDTTGSRPPADVWSQLSATLEGAVEDCDGLRTWREANPDVFERTVQRQAQRWVLEYRPAVCQACIELPVGQFDDSQWQAVMETRESTTAYVLRIFQGPSIDGATRVELSADQVFEVLAGDTLSCAFLHSEPLHEQSPYRSVMLGFEHPDFARGQRTLIIKDVDHRFGGDLQFTFPAEGLAQFQRVLNTPSKANRS